MTKRLIATIKVLSALIIFLVISNFGPMNLGWSGFEAYVAGIFAGHFVYCIIGDFMYVCFKNES